MFEIFLRLHETDFCQSLFDLFHIGVSDIVEIIGLVAIFGINRYTCSADQNRIDTSFLNSSDMYPARSRSEIVDQSIIRVFLVGVAAFLRLAHNIFDECRLVRKNRLSLKKFLNH